MAPRIYFILLYLLTGKEVKGSCKNIKPKIKGIQKLPEAKILSTIFTISFKFFQMLKNA